MIIRKKVPGFAPIEMLAVIALIVLLTAIVLVSVKGAREKSRKNTFREEVAALQKPLVLVCDSRMIRKSDFPNSGADTAATAWSEAVIARNSCGPQGNGSFLVMNIVPKTPLAGCTGVTLTQEGADFMNCP